MPENNYIPNSFQTPNIVVDELLYLLKGGEFKVYMFAIRHVYGWRNEIERGYSHMSYSMIEDGYEASTGTKFHGTGLSRQSITTALNALVEYRLLIKVKTGYDNVKGQAYAIGQDPDIEGLQRRAGIEPEVVKKLDPSNKGVVKKLDYPQSKNETTPSLKIRPKQTQQTHNKLTPQGDKAITQDLVWEFILRSVFGIEYSKISTPNDTIKRAFGRTNLIKRALTEIHQAHDTQLTVDHLRAFKTWFYDNHDYALPLSDVKLSELYLKFYHFNLKHRAEDNAPAFDSFDYSQLEIADIE